LHFKLVTKINEDDDDTSIEESVTEEKEESFKNDILLDSYLKQKEQVTTSECQSLDILLYIRW